MGVAQYSLKFSLNTSLEFECADVVRVCVCVCSLCVCMCVYVCKTSQQMCVYMCVYAAY